MIAAYYSAIFIYGWTAFLEPITTTFGWSMVQLSLGSSLRSLEVGVFNPLWGPVVDRYSSRKLMLFGVICTGLGIFSLSQTKNLAMYYAGFFIGGMGSSLVTGILPYTVIARWFRRNIGKANGIFSIGIGIGGVLVPVVVKIIDILGWQSTLLFFAIGFLVLGIPLSFFIRSRPADYGLSLDGEASNVPSGTRSMQLNDFGTSIKEALKMRAFWYLGTTYLWQMSVFSTISLYAIPYLTGLGMDRSTASMVVSLYTLVSLFGRIFMGIFSDIFRKSYIMSFSVVMMNFGLCFFWQISGTSSIWLILLFGIIFGVGLSGMTPIFPSILMEYFGTRNFGTIYGVASLFSTVAIVVSQPLAGWIYDSSHDYKVWWLGLLAWGVLASTVILTIPVAKKRKFPDIK